MIKAVLFDLDGTLVNSIGDLAQSTNFALSSLGFPTHEIDKYRYFIGDGMLMLIKRALPKDCLDERTIKECHKRFLEHYAAHYIDTTKEYEGITELLKTLKSKGYALGIVSNKSDEMTKVIANKLFCGVFDEVIGKREEFPVKPDPTSTLSVINDLNVSPNECLFVGDSGMDMLTAKNSGAIAVGVLWGFRSKEELISNSAKYLIDEPLKLLEVLEKENAEIHNN